VEVEELMQIGVTDMVPKGVLPEGAIPTAATTVVEYLDPDGAQKLYLIHSDEGTGWLHLGMVAAAVHTMKSDLSAGFEEDDD
jgi:hypothetical protein